MSESIVKVFLSNIPQDVYDEVSLNIDIANRIADMLKARRMTQREFAARMGKKESEISRWLTGAHGFNTNTLARIGHVLGEPVIFVEKKVVYSFLVNYSEARNFSFKKATQSNHRISDRYQYFNLVR